MSYLDLLVPDVRQIVESYYTWNQYGNINWILFQYIFDQYINPCEIHEDLTSFMYNFAKRIQGIALKHHVKIDLKIMYRQDQWKSIYYYYEPIFETMVIIPNEMLIELFEFFLNAKHGETPLYLFKKHRIDRREYRLETMHNINTKCINMKSKIRIVMYGYKYFEALLVC